MSTTAAWFIADANVLIDYTMTAPEVLGLVVAHIGEVYVATAVLDEVDDLDESRCVALGLTPIDGTLAQLTEASRRGGPLSFQDKLCLVLARDHGWACLSNDGPLRDACTAQGVSVVWGLEADRRHVRFEGERAQPEVAVDGLSDPIEDPKADKTARPSPTR